MRHSIVSQNQERPLNQGKKNLPISALIYIKRSENVYMFFLVLSLFFFFTRCLNFFHEVAGVRPFILRDRSCTGIASDRYQGTQTIWFCHQKSIFYQRVRRIKKQNVDIAHHPIHIFILFLTVSHINQEANHLATRHLQTASLPILSQMQRLVHEMHPWCRNWDSTWSVCMRYICIYTWIVFISITNVNWHTQRNTCCV